MKLDVPLIRQSKGAVDCGIAGLAMIMNYYGFNVLFDKLKKEISIDKIGTYAPQLGLYLIKKGFNVSIITQHPAIFTNKDKNLSDSDIKKRINILYIKKRTKSLGFFKKFLDSGGKIQIKIPDESDIINEIKNKKPLGALMTTNFIYGKEPKFNFHFNIITGIDDKYIYVNDPLPDSMGGKKKYSKKDFFYGLYASAYGDLDNASLILVKPK